MGKFSLLTWSRKSATMEYQNDRETEM